MSDLQRDQRPTDGLAQLDSGGSLVVTLLRGERAGTAAGVSCDSWNNLRELSRQRTEDYLSQLMRKAVAVSPHKVASRL